MNIPFLYIALVSCQAKFLQGLINSSDITAGKQIISRHETGVKVFFSFDSNVITNVLPIPSVSSSDRPKINLGDGIYYYLRPILIDASRE